MIRLDHAACRNSDPEMFNPSPHDLRGIEAARKMCGRCPIRQDCLELALNTRNAQGIWGGLTQRERTVYRRQQAGNGINAA
jgi:WhiB family redox-sensing transcriptional regulator